MKNQRIYMCEDSLEGILSAVHAAYMTAMAMNIKP